MMEKPTKLGLSFTVQALEKEKRFLCAICWINTYCELQSVFFFNILGADNC